MKTIVGIIKQNFRITGKLIYLLIIFPLLFGVCCSSLDEYPQYNPPADHTINNDGVMHKAGLSQPLVNCAGCHGADLKGGTVQVSCYECHGVQW